MKVNSTVALTLLLLSMMAGAGLISAAWGYALGREALKGITQPDVRPTSVGNEAGGTKPRHDEMMIVPENQILENVKNRIEGVPGNGIPAGARPTTADRPA